MSLLGKGRPVLITGGAGFIGANLADRLLGSGREVIVFDNLSRAGVEKNLEWLRERHGGLLQVVVGDVRDEPAVHEVVGKAAAVFHFAAQVAVTTSLTQPTDDFEVNARGTLNVLEALRCQSTPVPLLFTSTNKVYGGLPDVTLAKVGLRYTPASPAIAERGIGEARPLDFHSPYGCSKGAADQYVIDYARTFGIPATVFRMSCIYGPRQFGTEDQGWVAHFLIRAAAGAPLILYGDGMQVRDILFVDDLVDAFLAAHQHIDRTAGKAFNIGGGVANTTSLLEFVDLIGELTGARPVLTFSAWRPGDQRYYVSDICGFGEAVGWAPRVGVREGLERLYRWVLALRERSAAKPLAAVSAP